MTERPANRAESSVHSPRFFLGQRRLAADDPQRGGDENANASKDQSREQPAQVESPVPKQREKNAPVIHSERFNWSQPATLKTSVVYRVLRPHELVPSSDSEPLELPSYGLRAKGWDIELNEVNKQKFMEIFLQRGSKIEESDFALPFITTTSDLFLARLNASIFQEIAMIDSSKLVYSSCMPLYETLTQSYGDIQSKDSIFHTLRAKEILLHNACASENVSLISKSFGAISSFGSNVNNPAANSELFPSHAWISNKNFTIIEYVGGVDSGFLKVRFKENGWTYLAYRGRPNVLKSQKISQAEINQQVETYWTMCCVYKLVGMKLPEFRLYKSEVVYKFGILPDQTTLTDTCHVLLFLHEDSSLVLAELLKQEAKVLAYSYVGSTTMLQNMMSHFAIDCLFANTSCYARCNNTNVLWKKSELIYYDLRAALGQELFTEDVFLNTQTEYGETIKSFVSGKWDESEIDFHALREEWLAKLRRTFSELNLEVACVDDVSYTALSDQALMFQLRSLLTIAPDTLFSIRTAFRNLDDKYQKSHEAIFNARWSFLIKYCIAAEYATFGNVETLIKNLKKYPELYNQKECTDLLKIFYDYRLKVVFGLTAKPCTCCPNLKYRSLTDEELLELMQAQLQFQKQESPFSGEFLSSCFVCLYNITKLLAGFHGVWSSWCQHRLMSFLSNTEKLKCETKCKQEAGDLSYIRISPTQGCFVIRDVLLPDNRVVIYCVREAHTTQGSMLYLREDQSIQGKDLFELLECLHENNPFKKNLNSAKPSTNYKGRGGTFGKFLANECDCLYQEPYQSFQIVNSVQANRVSGLATEQRLRSLEINDINFDFDVELTIDGL